MDSSLVMKGRDLRRFGNQTVDLAACLLRFLQHWGTLEIESLVAEAHLHELVPPRLSSRHTIHDSAQTMHRKVLVMQLNRSIPHRMSIIHRR